MFKTILEFKNCTLAIKEKVLFENLNLQMSSGGLYALFGANGAGKSSFIKCIAGHDLYKLTNGKILLEGKSINNLSTEKRAQSGIFVTFQEPYEIDGVSVANLLRAAIKSYPHLSVSNLSVPDFYKYLYDLLESVGLPTTFTNRYVNVGFSGGEKKRFELLQLKFFKPKIAFLDELDSGLDINAVKLVVKTIQEMRKTTLFFVISHNIEFIKKLKPTKVLFLKKGEFLTVDNYHKSLDEFLQI